MLLLAHFSAGARAEYSDWQKIPPPLAEAHLLWLTELSDVSSSASQKWNSTEIRSKAMHYSPALLFLQGQLGWRGKNSVTHLQNNILKCRVFMLSFVMLFSSWKETRHACWQSNFWSKSVKISMNCSTYTCLFKLFPYDLEFSGVSWAMDNCKGRENCEKWSSSRHCVQSMCHMQYKQKTFSWGRKKEQGTKGTTWPLFLGDIYKFKYGRVCFFCYHVFFWVLECYWFCFVLDFRKYTSQLVTGSWSAHNVSFFPLWDTCLCNKGKF